jgi:hypothetical protein
MPFLNLFGIAGGGGGLNASDSILFLLSVFDIKMLCRRGGTLIIPALHNYKITKDNNIDLQDNPTHIVT